MSLKCAVLIGIVTLQLFSSSLAFNVSSPSFVNGSKMPTPYACITAGVAGANPELHISALPKGTQSLAILGWDDDAKVGLTSQWIVFDIPVTTKTIPQGVPIGANLLNFKQGKNTFGVLGYSAPCAEKGQKAHQIYFDIYALKVASLGLPAGSSLEAVHRAIKKTKMLEVKLMGLAGQ